MNKQEILNKIDQRWKDLTQSFEGLSENKMTQAAPKGGWSVKDILAHVAVWEEEALKNLPLIQENKRLPRYRDLYGGINAFNAMAHEKNKDLTLGEVQKNLERTHQTLMDYLQATPEEFFASQSRFRRRLAADSYNHYPEHTESILKLRGNKTKE